MVLVPDIGNSSGHTCSEVPSGDSEHNDTSSGHIFTAVVPRALDYSDCAGVSDSEPLADAAVDIQFSGSCAIQTGVAGDDVVLSHEILARTGRRKDRYAAS